MPRAVGAPSASKRPLPIPSARRSRANASALAAVSFIFFLRPFVFRFLSFVFCFGGILVQTTTRLSRHCRHCLAACYCHCGHCLAACYCFQPTSLKRARRFVDEEAELSDDHGELHAESDAGEESDMDGFIDDSTPQRAGPSQLCTPSALRTASSALPPSQDQTPDAEDEMVFYHRSLYQTPSSSLAYEEECDGADDSEEDDDDADVDVEGALEGVAGSEVTPGADGGRGAADAFDELATLDRPATSRDHRVRTQTAADSAKKSLQFGAAPFVASGGPAFSSTSLPATVAATAICGAGASVCGAAAASPSTPAPAAAPRVAAFATPAAGSLASLPVVSLTSGVVFADDGFDAPAGEGEGEGSLAGPLNVSAKRRDRSSVITRIPRSSAVVAGATASASHAFAGEMDADFAVSETTRPAVPSAIRPANWSGAPLPAASAVCVPQCGSASTAASSSSLCDTSAVALTDAFRALAGQTSPLVSEMTHPLRPLTLLVDAREVACASRVSSLLRNQFRVQTVVYPLGAGHYIVAPNVGVVRLCPTDLATLTGSVVAPTRTDRARGVLEAAIRSFECVYVLLQNDNSRTDRYLEAVGPPRTWERNLAQLCGVGAGGGARLRVIHAADDEQTARALRTLLDAHCQAAGGRGLCIPPSFQQYLRLGSSVPQWRSCFEFLMSVPRMNLVPAMALLDNHSWCVRDIVNLRAEELVLASRLRCTRTDTPPDAHPHTLEGEPAAAAGALLAPALNFKQAKAIALFLRRNYSAQNVLKFSLKG